jgi:membrane-associated phospholipid phosphatase
MLIRMKAEQKMLSLQWIIVAVAAILLAAVIIIVFTLNLTTPDATAAEITSGFITTNTKFILVITWLGNHSFLIPANLLLITFFLFTKTKWKALTVAMVALSSLGLMSLLKKIIQRHRPADPLVSGITNYSFPSGHAFMSIAFYGLLILFIYEAIQQRNKKILFTALLMLLIFLIGFSRVYLRVHYATDVVAGWCMGVIWLIAVVSLMNTWKSYLVRKSQA